MRVFHSLLLGFFLFSFLLSDTYTSIAQPIDELTLVNSTLISRDVKTTANWYRRFLKFKVGEYRPEKHIKMTRDGFQLTIRKGRSTLLADQIVFAKGKKYIHGIDKIGFSTNQFDSLHMYFQRYEQKLLAEPFFDQNLQMRTMIIKDPDGTKIQFFDTPDGAKDYKIKASFFAINASDYITTFKWYTEKMGFVEMEVKDDSNSHFQNYLQKDGIILELIHLPYESIETTEFMPVDRDLASVERIVFREGLAKKAVFETDNNGNKVVYKR